MTTSRCSDLALATPSSPSEAVITSNPALLRVIGLFRVVPGADIAVALTQRLGQANESLSASDILSMGCYPDVGDCGYLCYIAAEEKI